MTDRKFKADYLFTGREMAAAGSILVVTADGVVRDMLPPGEGGDDVETLHGILTPGLINCHCHLELSHMQGMIPENTGLVDFLLTVMRQRNTPPASETTSSTRTHPSSSASPGPSSTRPSSSASANPSSPVSAPDPADQLSAIARAERAMLDCGIVAVGDICNTPATIPQKALGNLYYHNFIETMGFVGATANDRYNQGLKVFEAFAAAYTYPLEANSLVPHAPYSVSSRLFGLIANFPGNQLLTIHNQESEAENEFYRSGQGDFLRLYQTMGIDTSFFPGTGKRSLESYLPHFYRNQTLILVHNVATAEEDIRALARPAQNPGSIESPPATGPRLYFCLCPNANRYISGQLPDIDLLVRSGQPIVLGTDSLASNHQLDILEEAKTLQARFPSLSTATILQWASSNGAEALQLSNVLGSFTPGKQPGVVLISGGEEDRLTSGAKATRLL